MSNVWVGSYGTGLQSASAIWFWVGRGFGRTNFNNGTNFSNRGFAGSATNFQGRGSGFGRGGFPRKWTGSATPKFYQFWSRADPRAGSVFPNVRPGTYTLHAIADGILGEFSLTNVNVASGEKKSLARRIGDRRVTGARFGKLGRRIAARASSDMAIITGNGAYIFDYPKEFPTT